MCEIMKKSKISQNVLQKSLTEKNDFLIFGCVKSFVGSSPSFWTPNFLSGAPKKCFNFMIAVDHNLIFSDHQKILKINLWGKAIIKLKPFPEAPNKKLGMENDWLKPTNIFTWPKITNLFISFVEFWQKFWEIFDLKKIKNGPFSSPIFHQTHLDNEKESYTMNKGTEKRKKSTSQIFD